MRRSLDLGDGYVVQEGEGVQDAVAFIAGSVVLVSPLSFDILEEVVLYALERVRKDAPDREAKGEVFYPAGDLGRLLDASVASAVRRTVALSFVVRTADAGQSADQVLHPYRPARLAPVQPLAPDETSLSCGRERGPS